jgi:hypothetical protein
VAGSPEAAVFYRYTDCPPSLLHILITPQATDRAAADEFQRHGEERLPQFFDLLD